MTQTVAERLRHVFAQETYAKEAAESFSWSPLWNHRRGSILFIGGVGVLTALGVTRFVMGAWVDAMLLLLVSSAMTLGQPKAYSLASGYWAIRYLKLSLLPQLAEVVDSNFSPVALLAVLIGLLWLIFPLIWFVGGFQVETLRRTKGRRDSQSNSKVSSNVVSGNE
jgi:hypothetical protein